MSIDRGGEWDDCPRISDLNLVLRSSEIPTIVGEMNSVDLCLTKEGVIVLCLDLHSIDNIRV